MKRILLFSLFLLFTVCSNIEAVNRSDKQRIIVTTDLGGSDPDDIQSFIHLLLCSDIIDIEGVISSQTWIDLPDNSALIKHYIDEYDNVLKNLSVHSNGYPTADYLKSVTCYGQSKCHMDGVGEGKDPDNDQLTFNWYIYKEASSYKEPVDIKYNDKSKCTIYIPKDAANHSIHLILEVTDSGSPALTSYRRIVLETK